MPDSLKFLLRVCQIPGGAGFFVTPESTTAGGGGGGGGVTVEKPHFQEHLLSFC